MKLPLIKFNRKLQQELKRLGVFALLLKRYARPQWVSLSAIVGLSLVLLVIGILSTALTAAIIEVLTGYGRPPTVPKELEWMSFNLNNISSLVYSFVSVSENSLLNTIVILSGIGVILAVLRGVLQIVTDAVSSYASSKMCRDMRKELFSHFMQFSLKFYYKNKSSDLVSRIDTDVTDSTSGLQAVISSLLINPLLLAFYFIITVRTSWLLVGAVFTAAVAHQLLTFILSRSEHTSIRKNLNIISDLRTLLFEVISNIRIIKSIGAETWEKSRLNKILNDLIKVNVFRQAINSVQGQGRFLINTLVQIIILIFAAYEMVNNRITLSSCLLFVYICQSVVKPITELSNAWVSIQRMVTSSERVVKIMHRAPDMVDGREPVAPFGRDLILRQVQFAYHKRVVLHELDLQIRKGEMIALVGPSGAGKSTLVDLLLRFFDPQSGIVLLDGRDIRTFQQQSYRQLFGVVSQETLLFNTTIRENITYARPDLSEEQLAKACSIAHVNEFLIQMPHGLDTLVGDRGVRLSGGQRQRLAIARAVVGEPQILILDEATSALDSESEKLVKEAIDQVTRQTTSIVIAHRLSTILNAHRIVVLDHGRIVGVGPHEEVLRTCPLYQKLYELQFKQPISTQSHGAV